MKPYTNPQKWLWICPICGEKLTSGGQGHINAQACGHMKKKHLEACIEGNTLNMGKFIAPGLKLGNEWRRSNKSGEESGK